MNNKNSRRENGQALLESLLLFGLMGFFLLTISRAGLNLRNMQKTQIETRRIAFAQAYYPEKDVQALLPNIIKKRLPNADLSQLPYHDFANQFAMTDPGILLVETTAAPSNEENPHKPIKTMILTNTYAQTTALSPALNGLPDFSHWLYPDDGMIANLEQGEPIKEIILKSKSDLLTESSQITHDF